MLALFAKTLSWSVFVLKPTLQVQKGLSLGSWVLGIEAHCAGSNGSRVLILVLGLEAHPAGSTGSQVSVLVSTTLNLEVYPLDLKNK